MTAQSDKRYQLTETQVNELAARIQESGAMPSNTRDGLLYWLQANLQQVNDSGDSEPTE